jgi:putative transposase
VSVATGCGLLGVARSTFYRVSRGYRHYRPVPAPMPHRDRTQPAALSALERQVIVNVLTCEEYQDLSVGQTYWRALDAGLVACSASTFYRVAGDHRLVGDRRRTRVRTGGQNTNRRTPIVHAGKVGDLWSWDITELPGPNNHRYKLYLVIDVFSRAPVAWRVEHNENTHHVIDMFTRAFTAHHRPRCLHADNGASMRAHALLDTLHQAGVLPSYSRPRVSDDNPFSESLFKTIKYDLAMPDRFDSLGHARAWTQNFLHRYATEHRHSGIGHHTPGSVLNDTAHLVHQHRQQALDTYYARHPERFTRPPQAPALPQPTGINTKLSQAA